MKIAPIIPLVFALSMILARSQENPRSVDWVSKDGRSIQARFLGLSDDFVALDRGGDPTAVAIGQLSPASRKLALEMARRQTPGQQVLAFCMARVGRKVGNGQCATLAVRALAAAGARSMGRDAPAPGDYAWGKPVARIAWNRGEVAGLDGLADIRPGDIIQFRDARFVGRASGGGNYWMTAMHHTAAVASADPVAMTLVAYHQNWGKKIVGKDLFRCADLKSGWLRIYRAIPTR